MCPPVRLSPYPTLGPLDIPEDAMKIARDCAMTIVAHEPTIIVDTDTFTRLTQSIGHAILQDRIARQLNV